MRICGNHTPVSGALEESVQVYNRVGGPYKFILKTNQVTYTNGLKLDVLLIVTCMSSAGLIT